MQTASLFCNQPDTDMPKLNIHCKTEGFRRAGRAWPQGDSVIDSADYSDAQIAALLEDTIMFTVTEIDGRTPNNPPTSQVDGNQAESGAGAPAPDNLIDRLVNAIAQLDPANPDHFTKGGKPEIKALEAAAGVNLDARLRDQAWKQARQG